MPSHTRWSCWRWAVALHLVAASAAVAQTTGRVSADSGTHAVARLIDGLPGSPVTLAMLLVVAGRENIDLRVATAAGREAVAVARAEGGVVDPQFELSTDRVPDVVGTGGVARYRSTALISTALPWGTRLEASSYRTSGAASRDVSGTSGYGVTLVQPLLEGLRQETATWRAAARDAEAERARATRAREEVNAQVALSYWGVGEAQATEAVYQRSLELSEALLGRSLELAKRDLVAQVDVLTLRSGVAVREALLNEARQLRRERSDALILLVYGSRAAARFAGDTLPLKSIDPSDSASVLPTGSDALATAMRQRSDVQAARLRLEAAGVRLARARNFRKPSLGVSAGYASDQLAGGATFANGDPGSRSGSWRLGLSLSTSVLNRRDLGTAQAASLGVDIESFRLSLAENTVLADVRTAERRVRMGRERLAMTTRGAEFAWAQLVAERRRLELGFSDAFRLLQTEENAVRTQLDAVRARYDVLRAQAQLALALGQVASIDGQPR